MLFKRKQVISNVDCGDVFYRRMQLSGREEARVLYVSDDGQGIPHVHYEGTLLSCGKKDPQGHRVLALDVFRRNFQVAH
ncbi:hypothetical protein [Sneathiella chinensis]|uniref:Uncharacterized protein n=1 Tax=Sneathiella chinensis TaxID=349750 RepID=A0ABQ5U4S0_9PROT|nr:hypothetical protein [Sneathiella chinensis]GLQ07155.1 hypothetical protein GCM10007924_23760 [Sneathiella chinensis]